MTKRIVLVPGNVKTHDRVGHHDYVAGCRLVADLLSRRSDVTAEVFGGGWPDDARVLEQADAVVFYEGGGGKQAVFREPARIDVMERLIDRAKGLMMLHQGVGFPNEHIDLGRRWLGGCYAPSVSKRGHWDSSHRQFPVHEVTRGVAPWSGGDGWLHHLEFVDGKRGVAPLVWSGPEHRGSMQGGDADIAGWVYERPDGGRSFAFTGLDSHSAWRADGLRTLVVNAALWIAGVPVPELGADTGIEEAALASYLTPRKSRATRILKKVFSPSSWTKRW
jgi:hypothetical protein